MKLATDGSYVILELGDKDLALTQEQILKWKEDAKMYNWAVKELGIGLSEAVHFFKEYKEDAEKWREWFDEPTTDIINDNRKIVERLEKRKVECETNSNKISMKDNWVEYKFQIRLAPELQKILEGKK